MKLYRSQASFRVRIALNLNGIAREDSFLHLEKGDQFAAAYRAINPQMVVPTLVDGDIKLFQSLAILEYLDEAVSGAAAIAGRPIGKGLGARARIDQRGRLAPTDRAACSPLFDGRAQGQR
jgi:glutathione S-transferase